MSETNTHSGLYKIALLSFSLLAQTVPLAAVANPSLMQTFTHQTPTQIQMIATVPNFAAILFTFLSTWIVKRVGAKRVVMLGMMLFIIGGVAPSFCSSYLLIVVFRIVMGAGVGLFSPFTVSLIYQLYRDDELNSMLGFQNSVQNIGSACFAFLLGGLVVMGWRAVYLGYLFAIIPLILFGLVFKLQPRESGVAQAKVNTEPKIKATTNASVIGYVILTIVVFMMFSMITVDLASFVLEKHIATAAVASSVLAGISISSLVSSALFGKLIKLFKNYMFFITFVGIAIGFALIMTAANVGMLLLGIIVVGLFFGWFFPQIFVRIDAVSPKGSENFSTSLVLIGVNVGVFIAPSVLNTLAAALGDPTPAMIFKIGMVGFAVLAVGNLLIQLLPKQQHQLIK